MTEEERRQQLIEQVKRKRLMAQVEAKRAAPVEPEPEPEVAATDARGITRALGQGAFMGWGDEITGGLVATAAKAGNLLGLNDDERGWGEIKDEVTGTERMEYDRYSKDNPIASLGTEIAGGLITDRFIPGGASRTASRIRRLSQALGRNVGEGAISGAGASDENRTQGALVGGGLGGMFGAALTGAGKVPALFSQRTVRTKLDDIAGNQRPIHLVTNPDAGGAEGAMGDFYRRGVGGSFGGRSVLKSQERPFIDAVDEAAETAAERLARTQETATQKLNADLDDLATNAATRKAQVSEGFQDKVDEVNLKAAQQSEMIKNAPELVLDTESRNLRRAASEAVMPDRMDPKTRQRLLAQDDPQATTAGLKGWWRSNGFDSVKKNNFKWNDGELTKTLKTVINEDPGLKLKIGSVPGMTDKMVKKLMNLKKDEVPTNISGEQLMAIRNVFAMASNNTSNKFDKGAMRTVANKFDDFIRKQLDGDDLAAFGDDLTRYGPAQTYFDAVDKAYKDGGKFNADQWLSVIPSGQRVQGQGLLQGAAGGARSRVNVAREAAKQQLKRGGAVPEATRTLTKALKRRSRKEARGVDASLKKARRKTREGAAKAPQLVRARNKAKRTKDAQRTINQRKIPNTSWPSQMVTTGAFGTPLAIAGGAIGGPAGLGVGLLAGRQVSKTLANPKVQKAAAGQLPWQRKLQIARKRYQDTPTKKNLKALRYAIQAATIRETQE